MNRDLNNSGDNSGIDTSSYSATSPDAITPDTRIIATFQETQISTSPLPPPELLAQYDQIINNGAERIMKMAEAQQEGYLRERRIASETNRDIAIRKLKYLDRGQIFGFIISLILIGLAAVFVFTDHDTMAYCLFSIGIVSLVALFLPGKNISRRKGSFTEDHPT